MTGRPFRMLPAALALLPLPATAAVPAGRCIQPSRVVSRRPVAPDRLDLALVGGRVASVTLAAPCPHLADLDRTHTILFDEREGDQLCPGDRFRIVDPLVLRAGGPAGYPFCRVASIAAAP